MKYAFFPGCKISWFCPQYHTSTLAVLQRLGIDFVEPEFNCCGYPVRGVNHQAFLLQAARNFAIAESINADILTPCQCCFGSLRHAQFFLAEDPKATAEINQLLAQEGLTYHGRLNIRHLLTVLTEDVGADAIRSQIQKTYRGLKIAAHYGCHALRPSPVVRFDNPFSPTIFENLIELTGAQSVPWSRRLECCGQPVAERNAGLSARLRELKIESAMAAGADFICTACTYCQMQLDAPCEFSAGSVDNRADQPSALLFPQLLGLSMGLDEAVLGLEKNRIRTKDLRHFL
jgi:heterodisulfide reductase subunit B